MSMRPQVLSYLLIARDDGGVAVHPEDHKVRWWLVPLAWVWAMVHGMWPVGIIIGLVAVVGIALDRAVPPRRGSGWRPSRCSRSWSPADPGRSRPVLRGARGQLAGQYFSEWQPPDFRDAEQDRAPHPRRRAARQPARRRHRGLLDPAAADAAGRGLGALHRAHRERRRHDARPLRGRGPPGRSARALARRAVGEVLSRAWRAPSPAWRCWRCSSPVPRTSRRPRTRTGTSDARRHAGRHRRAERLG